jgi:ribonuclease BN (tRNA processing enzyme)
MYGKDDVRSVMKKFFYEPYQPVNIEDFRAALNFHSMKNGDKIQIDKVTIKAKELIHPNGCLGYRVEFGNKSICYMTDIELAQYENYVELADFARNTDLLIIDAAYQDGKAIKGFGHSTPTECAELALAANAKRLALYHYGYMETDDDIDNLVESAKKIFPNTVGSFDGLTMNRLLA